ncbi:hypothetical protein D3C80_1262810 [compost metagenome]
MFLHIVVGVVFFALRFSAPGVFESVIVAIIGVVHPGNKCSVLALIHSAPVSLNKIPVNERFRGKF